MTGLPRESFEVYEDGEPQTVTQFTRERVPISLGVLVDVSDSMFGQRIQDARAAVDRFLFELLDPGDEFFILAFNHQPHVLTGWTSAPEVVRRALDGLRPSGGTAAYDAVLAALPLIDQRSRQRAAMLLISTDLGATQRECIRRLEKATFFSTYRQLPPGARGNTTLDNPTRPTQRQQRGAERSSNNRDGTTLARARRTETGSLSPISRLSSGGGSGAGTQLGRNSYEDSPDKIFR